MQEVSEADDTKVSLGKESGAEPLTHGDGNGYWVTPQEPDKADGHVESGACTKEDGSEAKAVWSRCS